MKLFKKQKGQGALEYLLLIGGAVLIAVIVIALLVGMGGQSRKAAQDQSESAKDALDVPQAAYITYLAPAGCIKNGTHALSEFSFSWNAVGGGGSHTLYIKNSKNEFIRFALSKPAQGDPIYVSEYDKQTNTWTTGPYELPYNTPTMSIFVNLSNGAQTAETECGDTYYAYIETTKNNQTVRSELYRFHW